MALAFVVLLSTFSFAIEKHFCGDVLVDASLFNQVQKCDMEVLEIELENVTKKSCCKDLVQVFEGQNEMNLQSSNQLLINQQLYIVFFFESYINLFKSQSKQIIPHKGYYPPLLITDLQILDQVFII